MKKEENREFKAAKRYGNFPDDDHLTSVPSIQEIESWLSKYDDFDGPIEDIRPEKVLKHIKKLISLFNEERLALGKLNSAKYYLKRSRKNIEEYRNNFL